MKEIELVLTSYSFLFTLGVAFAVLFIGWRVGVSSQQKDLIAILKVKNDILEKDLFKKDQELRDRISLETYHHHRREYQKNLATTPVLDSTTETLFKNPMMGSDHVQPTMGAN